LYINGTMCKGVVCMSLEEVNKRKKNKKKKRLIFRTAILGVMIAAVVFALISNFNKDKTIYGVGDQAPDFQLQQINKNNELETVRLSDLEGKGVMLNFWATYCKPCEAEMPFMQDLYGDYKDNGIEIVAVNLDANKLVVDRFIDKFDLTFPTPYDGKSEVMDLYKVGPIPSTFFINPDGEIEDIVEGALTLERLEGYLKEIQHNEYSNNITVRDLNMKKIKCECGHVNPEETILCESCGKPIEENQHVEGNDKRKLLNMRYDGTARRSLTYNKSIVDKIWNFFSS